MPQFDTSKRIYEAIYLKDTGINLNSITYSFEADGITKNITPTLEELRAGFYVFSFVCDTATDNLTLRINYGDYYLSFNYIIGTETYSEVQSGQKHYFRVYLGETGVTINDIVLNLYEQKTPSIDIITFEEDALGFYDLAFTSSSDTFYSLTVEYKPFWIICSVFTNAGPTSGGGGTTIIYAEDISVTVEDMENVSV